MMVIDQLIQQPYTNPSLLRNYYHQISSKWMYWYN